MRVASHPRSKKLAENHDIDFNRCTLPNVGCIAGRMPALGIGEDDLRTTAVNLVALRGVLFHRLVTVHCRSENSLDCGTTNEALHRLLCQAPICSMLGRIWRRHRFGKNLCYCFHPCRPTNSSHLGGTRTRRYETACRSGDIETPPPPLVRGACKVGAVKPASRKVDRGRKAGLNTPIGHWPTFKAQLFPRWKCPTILPKPARRQRSTSRWSRIKSRPARRRSRRFGSAAMRALRLEISRAMVSAESASCSP
jgi:hypothetical protein